MSPKLSLKSMKTRWYLFCGGFGGALGAFNLHMDNWEFWVLLVYVVIASAWAMNGEKEAAA